MKGEPPQVGSWCSKWHHVSVTALMLPLAGVTMPLKAAPIVGSAVMCNTPHRIPCLQIFGLEWNPFEVSHEMPLQFVTFGKRHIKMWDQGTDVRNNTAYSGSPLVMGKLTLQHVMAVQWLTPVADTDESLLAAGMADGQVYLFRCVMRLLFLHCTAGAACQSPSSDPNCIKSLVVAGKADGHLHAVCINKKSPKLFENVRCVCLISSICQ